MKKVLLTLMVCVGLILSAQAQKFGYLNSNELLSMMPESVEMQEELQSYAKGLESQLTAMQAEYEKKVVEYQQNETTYTDLVKEDKIREIESIQQRVVEFQKNAQQSLGEKEAELFTPIREKAMMAIDKVAKEGNYTFIFDSGAGSFLYAAESENVLSLVKSKLGL
ncbi:OmpH family outer membrane protein [Flavobacteriales bacterium]|jgi:outer membrane protein|nr:OmpH family outer membrane protein [Flavobacteriales bacterium]MDB2675323.1 OmpH family outer membrane protein [Flavobacteriales bacterium]